MAVALAVALPALLALVSSGPWRLPGSEPPPGLLRELEGRQRDLSRLAAVIQARVSLAPSPPPPAGRALGCADLEGAAGVSLVGSGITKVVVRAVLPPAGQEVALKSVHGGGRDVNRCVQRYGHQAGCHRLAAYKLLKEATLLQSLEHPGIIELRGQCYDGRADPEMKITTILELGTPLEMIELLQTPWEKRFKICLDLVELLYYLANSPLGSIALLDFQPRQFVIVDGVLKVTDLDDISTEELSCQTDEDCVLEFPTKNFSLRCTMCGKCEGINERRNLFNAYRYFFTYLLPHTAPSVLQPILKDILNATGDLRYGVNETLRAFQKVLHLYKSGLYLQKKPSHLKEYIALKGFHSGTAEDYKCWPSYSHSGCVLSVHNAEEAADICSSHSQCQHFIITPQKTWTVSDADLGELGLDARSAMKAYWVALGAENAIVSHFGSHWGEKQGRPLALFQSSSADLIPGGNTVVYMKRSAVSRGKPLTRSPNGYRVVGEEIPTGTNFGFPGR